MFEFVLESVLAIWKMGLETPDRGRSVLNGQLEVCSKLVKNHYTICRRIKVFEAYLSSIAQMCRESA